MIYKTAGESITEAARNPPKRGEYVSRNGFYLTGQQHAYVDGTFVTLCGIHLTRLAGILSELRWSEGADYPPRCPTCSARAV